jgi:Zn-dependent peptidase ImmA (M78 family)
LVALRRGFKTWCENASRGYRRELRLAPVAPLDPRVLARHLGITVWTPADIPGLNSRDVYHLTVAAPESWSAATLRKEASSLIIINNSHALTRQNNSLAHEIGHIVLNHEPAKMYVTPDGLMMMSEYNLEHEDEATWFAGAILLPRDALLDVARRGLSDHAAADQYGVSRAVLQMRRNLTGVAVQLSRHRGVWAP